MAGENAYNLSTTPSNNLDIGGNGVDGSVDSPSSFDDALRALASFLPELIRDIGGANTVGGSANALTLTPSGGAINSLFNGLLIAGEIASDNSSTTVTLNVGGTGAEPVKKAVDGVETDPAVGDLQDGMVAVFRWRSAWDSSGGAWELVNPRTTVGSLDAIAAALKSGDDAAIITGTAGQENYLAKWNGDGDLVEGQDVLDEDDFASDSDTSVATQQSIKAFVENYVDTAQTYTQFALRSDQTSTGVITGTWGTIADVNNGNFGALVTESSGVFTFPSTGYWRVGMGITFDITGETASLDEETATIQIVTTLDNFSSSDEVAEVTMHGADGQAIMNGFMETILDIEDTDNEKVRFNIGTLTAGEIKGSTNRRVSYVFFHRLGPT